MRTAIALAALALAAPAAATEVVWLTDPPSDEAAVRVAAQAGAVGAPLRAIDLRSAATGWSDADAAAYEALEQTLRDVREFETRLDGELLIMRDLERPIGDIALVRDGDDRGKLFAALTYQGFAVDRFFAGDLATDERAADYRVDLDGRAVEAPWFHAVALEPTRKVTPYEIAEAPQRVAYGEVQALISSWALPASIVFPDGLPAGAEAVVDGRPAELGSTSSLRLLPGRHLVHVELQDRVIARYDVSLDSGGSVELDVDLDDQTWKAWVAGVRSGDAPATPKALIPHVRALGGSVWVAFRDGADTKVYTLDTRGLTEVEIERERVERPASTGLSVAVGLGGGWLASGDFYNQNPSTPNTRRTVNAGTAAVGLDAAYDLGILRFGAGVELPFTFGDHHFARYGTASTRLRPYPYVAAGVTWAQVTGGWLFPYHPAVGLRATVPLVAGLELRGHGMWGLPTTLTRDNDSTYTTLSVWSAHLGVGWRLGL